MSLKNASPISMTVPGPADFSSAALRSSLYQKLVDSFPWYVWWLAPAVIILAVITLFPFFWMIYISFMKVQLAPGATDMFVGWSNWRQMFLDRSVYDGWQLLFEYVATCMVLQMALGLGIALLLNDIKREGLIVTVIMIPMMVAPVVVGHLFNLLLNSSYGLYAWILKSLGIYSAGSLLSNPSTALWALVAMDTWEWTPLIVLILLAGLKSVPRDTIEAAHVDGSSPWQVFMNVTLPYLRPSLLIAFLLRFMDCMRFIDNNLITTRGGPAEATSTLPIYLYFKSFREFNIGMGAVIGFTLLVAIIICALLASNILLKEQKGENHA